jgi:polyferredoxin
LLRFCRVRFPFTFMGLVALAIGVWIAAYLAVRPALDPVSRALAAGTAVMCFAFGVYVVIRRVRRGPQH